MCLWYNIYIEERYKIRRHFIFRNSETERFTNPYRPVHSYLPTPKGSRIIIKNKLNNMKNIFQAARYTSFAMMGFTLLTAILFIATLFSGNSHTITSISKIANLLISIVFILFWGNFCWLCGKKAPILKPAAILCAAFILQAIISIMNMNVRMIMNVSFFSGILWPIIVALPVICLVVGILMLGRFFPKKTPIKNVIIAIPILILWEALIMPLVFSSFTVSIDNIGEAITTYSRVDSLVSLAINALWAIFYYLFYKTGTNKQ